MDFRDGYKIVRLANGVHSVHSLAHQETFHPVIGPVAEAEALYVKQLDLVKRFRSQPGEFVIWDVGLGAAANSLTILRSLSPFPGAVRLISFDNTTEPLGFALHHGEALGYLGGFEEQLGALLAQKRIEFKIGQIGVRWEIKTEDFPALLKTSAAQSIPKPNVILFDAYSPAKNPAMWTQPLFSDLFSLLDTSRPCALATYSRSTLVRVSLLLAGFFVGSGHATGEKEETTIAANVLDLIGDPLDKVWLARAKKSTSAEPLWEPKYHQARLSPETWERLQQHRQFR